MKEIRNTTLQFLSIPVKGDSKVVDLSLRPGQIALVPDSYNSNILETLIRRRQVKVRIIKDNK